jgi:hypothetical protein
MRLLSRTKYFLLLFLFLFSSCEEEVDSEALVFVEDVIFVSGEILRITGRVVSSGTVTITDHGFQVAENPEFTSPIIISLGERSIPGRFIGTYEELPSGTDFFVRAFLINKGETSVSAALEFSTLDSELINYTPVFERAGQTITINGKNLTRDSEVFFGSQKALILEFNNEAEIKVRAPNPEIGEYMVPIRIINDGKENVFDQNFEYIIGKWQLETIYPGNEGFTRNIYFQHEGILYSGMEDNGSNVQLFWKYDLLSKSWQEKNFNGPYLRSPGVFDGGFFGGGLDNNALSNEFWTLDQSGNFLAQGNVPFKLVQHVSFRVGDELFVFGGKNESRGDNNRIRKYNFVSKEWVELGTMPIITSSTLPKFNKGNQMFFVTASNELWKYDSNTMQWQQMTSYPGAKGAIGGGTIGEYAYVGLGNNTREMYEYNFALDYWKQKSIIPGFNSDLTLGWYTVDDKIFVLRKVSLGSEAPKMYKFEPFNF